ncbi:hypothetical protein SH661x_000438 [Planctomicrobium sp. SH661]|uniref:hypothetical protein n=1 Tax=Planctomicrobium sp. SH661 TaxID=3448124 RepID=UPI003F5C713F
MTRVIAGPEQLKNLFSALTEQTFQVELGVADPPLIDYLSTLLTRFVRIDSIFRLRDIVGRRLDEVADMLMEAEQCDVRPRSEFHRHIGDFTLFWTGVYPEALKRLKGFDRKDAMIDYQEQGKRSYYIASKLSETLPQPDQAAVLRRLSHEFELCSEGLRKVRAEWERLPAHRGNCDG